jgi:hypothetical protein
MRRIVCVAKDLAASQKRLFSMEVIVVLWFKFEIIQKLLPSIEVNTTGKI